LDKRRRSARIWVIVALGFLLLALFAYGGNVQGKLSNSVAVPLALLGVVGFAAATIIATFVKRSMRR